MADQRPLPARPASATADYVALLSLWIALAAWPFVAPNEYLASLGGTFFINLLLISSLNLLVGYAGQISLAHAAFYGLGAYTSGIISVRCGVSPWLTTILAAIVPALIAALVGIPTLRTKGHYLAMATLGLNAIISVLFVGLIGVTGGPNGLSGIPSYAIGPLDLSGPTGFFFVAWAISGLVMLGLLNLVRSRVGLGLRAIAITDIAASCMGIPVKHYKLTIFAISAGIAGLAGALYAHQSNYVSPETFSFFTSVLLLVMTAVGGFGKYWGGLVGALIFTFVPEMMRSFPDLELLLFGVLMIVAVGFLPGGIANVLSGLTSRMGLSRRG